jgi:hypothetical protein
VGGLYLSGEGRRHVRLPGHIDREADELDTEVAVLVPGGTGEFRYNTKLGLTVVTWNKLSEWHSSGVGGLRSSYFLVRKTVGAVKLKAKPDCVDR